MSGSIVAVVAHPDDESLIAGGTLALAARDGIDTGAVSLTRGEHGPISDPELGTRDELPDVRARELARAGEILGLGWTACLHYPDGELPWVDHARAAAALAELLERHRPAAILTFGADGLYGHPDHAAAAEIATRAIRVLAAPVEVYEAAWPSGLVAELAAAAAARGLPHGLWGIEPEAFGSDREPTVRIDVRPVLETKLAALRAHRTQLGDDHLLSALPLDLAERYLGFETWTGPPEGTLGEALRGG